jgi:phosphoglycolate phosphatase
VKLFCDLDGTLIDVSVRHYKIYTEVTEQFNGKPLDKKTYWHLKRSKATWPELLPKSGLSADKVEEYLEEFRKKIEDPEYLRIDKLVPGALEAIGLLATKYECYLLSLRRKQENLRAQLGWLDLAPHFTKILSGHSESDGVDVKVPLIRQTLGDDKGVIIGDTEADIVTGKQLGLKTVAVLSGLRSRELLEVMQPDHLVASIAEAPTLLIPSE